MKVNVITLNGVDKYYDNYPALKNISLNVEDGQIYSYLGPNGSGKTTTIKIILGLLKPSSGSVEILGEDPYLDNIRFIACKRAYWFNVRMGWFIFKSNWNGKCSLLGRNIRTKQT